MAQRCKATFEYILWRGELAFFRFAAQELRDEYRGSSNLCWPLRPNLSISLGKELAAQGSRLVVNGQKRCVKGCAINVAIQATFGPVYWSSRVHPSGMLRI